MSTNAPVPALDLTAMESGEPELARKPSLSKKMSTRLKNLITPRSNKKDSTSPTGTAPDIAKSSATSLFRVPSLPRSKEPAVPAPTPFAAAPEPAAAARGPASTPAAATAAAPAAAPAAPVAGAAPVFAPITAPVAPPRPAVTAAPVPSSAPAAVAAPPASVPAPADAPRDVTASAAPVAAPAPAAAAPAAPVATPAPAAPEPAAAKALTPVKPTLFEEQALHTAPAEPATPGSAEWEQQASLEQSTNVSEHSVTAGTTVTDVHVDEASVVVTTPAKDTSPLTAKVKAPPRPGTRESKGLPRGLLTFAVVALAAGLAISGSKKAQGKRPAPAIQLVRPVGKTGWGRK